MEVGQEFTLKTKVVLKQHKSYEPELCGYMRAAMAARLKISQTTLNTLKLFLGDLWTFRRAEKRFSLGSLRSALDAGISSPSCSWQLSQQIYRAYEQEENDCLRRTDDLIHSALDDPHKHTQTKTIALAHTMHNPLQISQHGPLFSFEYNGGFGNCDTAIKFLSKQIITMELRGAKH